MTKDIIGIKLENMGAQMLYERMTSNPDEFLPVEPYGTPPNKWRRILDALQTRHEMMCGRGNQTPLGLGSAYADLPFLSDADIDRLFTKLNSIRGDCFTKEVMATLLKDSDDQSYDSSRVQNGYSQAYKQSKLVTLAPTPNNMSTVMHPALGAPYTITPTGVPLTNTTAAVQNGDAYKTITNGTSGKTK